MPIENAQIVAPQDIEAHELEENQREGVSIMENIDELISKANEMQSVDERTRFIMNYFLENVRYNYAYLFAVGYAQGTTSVFSPNLVVAINKTRADGDEKYSLTRSVIQGESRIFNEILQIRDRNNGDYNKFIEELRAFIVQEISTRLGNEEIVSKSAETVIQKIEAGLREKKKVSFKGKEDYLNYDISKVLIDFFLEPKKYFPPEFDNGIITNGVCKDYTDYLVSVLHRAGIEAHSIEGTSELTHAWVIVKSEEGYKSVDLTRAVFIRDGFLGIPTDQKSQDWLYTNMRRMFEMQGTRTITKIDNIVLPTSITSTNFDEQDFKELMEQIVQRKVKDSKFKQILDEALGDGISGDECQNANAKEQSRGDMEEQRYGGTKR